MREEKISENLSCWICGNTAIGVARLPLGAISGAYCKDCLEAGREPWSVLVGSLMFLTPETVHPGLKPLIDATLKFYKKTEQDLWDDIKNGG